jgi:hypothetical protein
MTRSSYRVLKSGYLLGYLQIYNNDNLTSRALSGLTQILGFYRLSTMNHYKLLMV